MKRIVHILLLTIYCFSHVQAELVLQTLDYADGREQLENPHIGFYRPVGKHFKTEGNTRSNTWGNLTHLRMDISEFSSEAILGVDPSTGNTLHGVSQPLTEDMLNAFEDLLNTVRQRGASAIVRFAYDPNYGGSKNCDPEQSVILAHLRQLGEVYARNADVIVYVELGMYGSWGEMHSSNNGTNENIAEALQTLLACTPPEIKIGVRRPDIVAYWLGVNDGNDYSGFDINSDKFKHALEEKGDTIYRVGMYNDGYLGSDSDLGTVGMGAAGKKMTRNMMVEWLKEYSQHTPYGGELVANNNGNHPINTPAYLSNEGFLTHTSYLNYEWHQPTILGWKDSTYVGEEKEYNGCDGFTYVSNHLGYRFVLRSSYLPEFSQQDGEVEVMFEVENVGFANLTKSKKVTFILYDGNAYYEVAPNEPIDPMEWLSQKSTTVHASFQLPMSLEKKDYQLYLRLSEQGDLSMDNHLYEIRFGNNSEQYNKTVGANLLGEIHVVDHTSFVNDNREVVNCLYSDNKLIIKDCDELLIYSYDGRVLLHESWDGTDLIIPFQFTEPFLVNIKSHGQWMVKKLSM